MELKARDEKARLGAVTSQTKFELAALYCGSPRTHIVQQGIALFHDLVQTDGPERDYLFYLAQGYLALGQYTLARQFAEQVLELEPRNSQAKTLLSEIKQKESRGALMRVHCLVCALLQWLLISLGLQPIAAPHATLGHLCTPSQRHIRA